MGTVILTTYATLGLIFFVHAAFRLMFAGRKPEILLTGADRFLLVAVALLTSAAWLLLVPIYAAGWVRAGHASRLRRSLAGQKATVAGSHRGIALAR